MIQLQTSFSSDLAHEVLFLLRRVDLETPAILAVGLKGCECYTMAPPGGIFVQEHDFHPASHQIIVFLPQVSAGLRGPGLQCTCISVLAELRFLAESVCNFIRMNLLWSHPGVGALSHFILPQRKRRLSLFTDGDSGAWRV